MLHSDVIMLDMFTTVVNFISSHMVDSVNLESCFIVA